MTNTVGKTAPQRLGRARTRRRGHEYGQSWMVAAALLDGPRTIDELEKYYRVLGRRFAVFLDVWDRSRKARSLDGGPPKSEIRMNLERCLDLVRERGWVVREGECYRITDEGRVEARKMIDDLERSGRFIEMATQPTTVSMVTLVVHFVLAAIKLPAAVLSGSVGLLNDSLDTLMDGVSSLFVYIGVRSGRERLVSYVLLLFMTVTGCYSLYEAVARFFRPEPLSRDWTVFIAVGISAVVCGLLWVYQKYAGLKHSCVPLIAQSIDSRNHVLVAVGVTAALVAAWFRFTLLDHIVGIVVAVLILRGALELLVDLVRSGDDEELDLSKYGFSRLEKHRHRQTVRWLLFEIDKKHITTREALLRQARAATDFERIASLKALGLHQPSKHEEKLRGAVEEIFERGLAAETVASAGNESPEQISALRLTEAGEAELGRALADTLDSLSTSHSSGSRGSLAKAGFLVVRVAISLAFFAVIYAAGRWLIGLLPTLDVWDAAGGWSLFPHITASLEATVLMRRFTVGPLSLTGAEWLCAVIGIVFVYRGRTLQHRARHAIRHARRHGWKTPLYLVTDGPYAVRRHPMYAGAMLIAIGFGVGLHAVYSLAWAGLAACVMFVNALLEERSLSAWFGREYAKYAGEVKQRLLPWWEWVLAAMVYGAAWMG